MGESPKAEISVYSSELESFSVETPGGRIQIRWDYQASATPNAQLAFFAEFLATAGVYEAWVDSCPLTYSSGNASQKRDVLGTWFLSILAGHHRYAHITGVRGDGVSPQILGMSKIVSEDALRRALGRLTAEQSQNWLRPQLLASVQAALETPWILDIDTTIKTLFGKQSGAEVSYNPHKPGRPSHALHTYFVSNLRMVLDVVVSPGKQHSAAHARPGLSDILDSLSKEQLPSLVRGDCGFGNEPLIDELEKRNQLYLFKLRQTSGVKKLLMRQFARKDWTTPGPSDQGWSVVGVCGAGDQQRLSTGVDGAVIPRPRRCGKRLRRVEEPVGLGRLYDARHRTLPDQCSRRGADLQLVELVLQGGQARSPDGGHHQPGAAVGIGGPGHPARRANHAVSDADARRQDHTNGADRQYPSGS
jgi:hypothetical protein